MKDPASPRKHDCVYAFHTSDLLTTSQLERLIADQEIRVKEARQQLKEHDGFMSKQLKDLQDSLDLLKRALRQLERSYDLLHYFGESDVSPFYRKQPHTTKSRTDEAASRRPLKTQLARDDKVHAEQGGFKG